MTDKIPIKIYRNLYAELSNKITPRISELKENIEKSVTVPKEIMVRIEDLQKATGFDWMSEAIFKDLIFFRLLEDDIVMKASRYSEKFGTVIPLRIVRPGTVEVDLVKYLTKLHDYDVVDGYIVKRPIYK